MNPNYTDENGLETTYIQHMMERYNNNSSSPVIFPEPDTNRNRNRGESPRQLICTSPRLLLAYSRRSGTGLCSAIPTPPKGKLCTLSATSMAMIRNGGLKTRLSLLVRKTKAGLSWDTQSVAMATAGGFRGLLVNVVAIVTGFASSSGSYLHRLHHVRWERC